MGAGCVLKVVLSDEQIRTLQRHRQALQKCFANAGGDTNIAEISAAVLSATQWGNELFHLAASMDSSSGEDGTGTGARRGRGVLLCPRLLSAPAAWEWLIGGANPVATLSSAHQARGVAAWVRRSQQVCTEQRQRGLEAAEEMQQLALRRQAEEAAAHAGETRALKTRLGELEGLLRNVSLAASSSEHQAGKEGGHKGSVGSDTLAAKLQQENQVFSTIAYFPYCSLYCVSVCVRC